jgi:hypothetical protein
MSVTNRQFNRALAELQDPYRQILVEDRWREILPEVHPDEFRALRSRCDEIERFAYGLAERVRKEELGAWRAMLQLFLKYPFLTLEGLDRTWNRAMFSSR